MPKTVRRKRSNTRRTRTRKAISTCKRLVQNQYRYKSPSRKPKRPAHNNNVQSKTIGGTNDGKINKAKLPRIIEAFKKVIKAGYTLLVHNNRYFFIRVCDTVFIFFEGVFREDENDDVISTSYICVREANKLKKSCVEVKQYRFSNDPNKPPDSLNGTELMTDAVAKKYETDNKCVQLLALPESLHGVHKLDSKETKRKIAFDLLEPFQLCITKGQISCDINGTESLIKIDSSTEHYEQKIEDTLSINMEQLQPDLEAMNQYLKNLSSTAYFVYFTLENSESLIPGFILQQRHYKDSLLADIKERQEDSTPQDITRLYELKIFIDSFRRNLFGIVGLTTFEFFAKTAVRQVPGFNTIVSMIEKAQEMITEHGQHVQEQTSKIEELVSLRENLSHDSNCPNEPDTTTVPIKEVNEIQNITLTETTYKERLIAGVVSDMREKDKLRLATKHFSDPYQLNQLLRSRLHFIDDTPIIHRIIPQTYTLPQCVQIIQLFAKVMVHERFTKKDTGDSDSHPCAFKLNEIEKSPWCQLKQSPEHTVEGGETYYYYYLTLCIYKKTTRETKSLSGKMKEQFSFSKQLYIKGAIMHPESVRIQVAEKIVDHSTSSTLPLVNPVYHIPQKMPNSVHNFYKITELQKEIEQLKAKLSETKEA